MISEAKLRANRENAKKSTGPKTTEGKERVSQNARKHGFRSEKAHYKDSIDYEEMAQLLIAFVDEMRPETDDEYVMIRGMADALARLKKLKELAAGLGTEMSLDAESALLIREYKIFGDYQDHLDRFIAGRKFSPSKATPNLRQSHQDRRTQP